MLPWGSGGEAFRNCTRPRPFPLKGSLGDLAGRLEENGQFVPVKRIRRCKGTELETVWAWAGNGQGQRIWCEVETGVGGTAEEIKSGRPVQCVGLKQSRHCRKTEIWEHVNPGKSSSERSDSPDTSCFCNQLYFDMQIPYMAHFVTKLHPWTLPSVELIRGQRRN